MRIALFAAMMAFGVFGLTGPAPAHKGDTRTSEPRAVQTEGSFILAQNVQCNRRGCRTLRPGCRVSRTGGFAARVVCDGPGGRGGPREMGPGTGGGRR